MAIVTALTTALGAGLSAAAGGAAATGAAAAASGVGTAAAVGTGIQASAGTIGTLLTAAGTGTSLYGNIQASQASKEAEDIRRRQMFQNAQRERRTAVRNAMRQQAATASAGVSQGAFEGSGVGGGLAQATSGAGQAIGDTNINNTLGSQMFAANAQMSQGRTIASIGAGASQLGRQLVSDAPAIGRIGAQLFSRPLANDPYWPYDSQSEV